MTTNDKQPTGWVVVDFGDGFVPFCGSGGWRFTGESANLVPYTTAENVRLYKGQEVHPWPLPASVLARLKAKHPGQDWSQVPVADAPVEKPGRWVVHEVGDCCVPFRDQDGWQPSADVCAFPWRAKADVEAFMRAKGWDTECFVPVNLDDLPSPAVAEPSEVERLRARVGWLDMLDTEEGRRTFADEKLRVEVEELRGALIECVKACGGGATERVSTEFLMGTPGEVRLCIANLRAEVEKLRPYAPQPFDASLPTYTTLAKEHGEQDIEIEELRKIVICCAVKVGVRLADEVSHESLLLIPGEVGAVVQRLTRERDEALAELGKSRLSRLDEFAKAALTGLLADPEGSGDHEFFASEAVLFAQATIRAIDGAGGA